MPSAYRILRRTFLLVTLRTTLLLPGIILRDRSLKYGYYLIYTRLPNAKREMRNRGGWSVRQRSGQFVQVIINLNTGKCAVRSSRGGGRFVKGVIHVGVMHVECVHGGSVPSLRWVVVGHVGKKDNIYRNELEKMKTVFDSQTLKSGGCLEQIPILDHLLKEVSCILTPNLLSGRHSSTRFHLYWIPGLHRGTMPTSCNLRRKVVC